MNAMSTDCDLISQIGQFYYREARLLDERRYQQWLMMIDSSIEYTVPLRYVPLQDPQKQGSEEFLSIERELDGADKISGSPIRRESYMELFIRTMRPFKTSAWAESPPPRTRRCISNIEVEPITENEYRVYSNFQLFYSHNGAENHTYTGCRRDIVKKIRNEFFIFKRVVITDWDIITAPTMALIF